MKILILNGPNLNLLGKREPLIYGAQSFEEYFAQLKNDFPAIELHYYQSNVEGELINKLHEVGFTFDGIVFNPGGYTHTSVAIGDAVAAISAPLIEVHISNTLAREEFRHNSFVGPKAKGIIIGLGLNGYRLAIEALTQTI
jgi:3-dehydroquinate dehydratase-2